jgi:DNA-binding NarL/FixJ family response regulator
LVLMFVRAADVSELLRLFRASIELADQPDENGHVLLNGLLRIIGATVGAFVLSSDYRPHGAAGVVREVTLGFDDPAQRRMLELYRGHGGKIDPMIVAHMKTTGYLRTGAVATRVRQELVPDHEWYRSSAFEHIRSPARLDDTILSARGTDAKGVVDAVFIAREVGAARFEAEDRNLVAIFHEEIGLIYEATVERTLTERQRQTLRLLVDGATEKQIAARLRLSAHTVHHYVAALYRAFAVTNRAQLIARLRSSASGGGPWRAAGPDAPAPPNHDDAILLPPRLRHTLSALLQGGSEKEIAATLGISRHTVHEYVQEIYRRMNVRSRPELMAAVLRLKS